MKITLNTVRVSVLLVLIVALIALVAYFGLRSPQEALGSVSSTDEYQATTTFAASSPTVRTLRTKQGSLGQVTITGANTGLITLYDATTSDVTLRTGGLASSSILIADFPASAAAGTYTFDAKFTTGLLLVTSGLTPTTTITYRQ
jgi:hypothetical protein